MSEQVGLREALETEMERSDLTDGPYAAGYRQGLHFAISELAALRTVSVTPAQHDYTALAPEHIEAVLLGNDPDGGSYVAVPPDARIIVTAAQLRGLLDGAAQVSAEGDAAEPVSEQDRMATMDILNEWRDGKASNQCVWCSEAKEVIAAIDAGHIEYRPKSMIETATNESAPRTTQSRARTVAARCADAFAGDVPFDETGQCAEADFCSWPLCEAGRRTPRTEERTS